MIARLKGVVVHKSDGTIIVDVDGIGYEVNVTQDDSDEISNDQDVVVYIYDHIRENSHELFGFLNSESKVLFEMLLTVSGVGPKMALSILDLGEPKQIRSAIAAGNTAYIAGASGVGKRLAERVSVDLKDKVGYVVGEELIEISDVDDDTIGALMSLGYNRAQSQNALRKVDREAPVEEQIKQALKEMS